MAEFKYAPMFQLGEDKTEYYKIPGSEQYVSTGEFEGHEILKIAACPYLLTLLTVDDSCTCILAERKFSLAGNLSIAEESKGYILVIL